MKHVIIGTGPAGVVAAETLRKLEPESGITLIGDEPEPPYSRMAIPYFLEGKIDASGTHLRKSSNYFEKNNIEVLRTRIDAINTDKKSLFYSAGQEIRFDKLLIATGSSPVKPPIEGMDLPGVYTCWTLADAKQIIDRAKPDAKVVLMGAGFIGCIILEALASRNVQLTVVEMENRMVPRMMNKQSGTMLKQWCENKGVTVLTSAQVKGIEKSSKPMSFLRSIFTSAQAKSIEKNGKSPLSVSMSGGGTLPADMVICATGVRSNMDLCEQSDIQTDQGILVNEYLQTSSSDIYAAGDVAQGLDFSTGNYSVQAIQPTAVEHARIAATNMAEISEHLHRGSINMNVLDTLGLISSSFGDWQGLQGDDSSELKDIDRYRYLNLQFQGDVLIGANTLGLTQHIGVLRGLIQSKTRLGTWKKKLTNDPTLIMEAYLATAQGQA
ncbi:MAG: NAD(P)/FAD-dependent oxidoreductase [Gammaproteobacteria bacterium]|nr:NAD(P)/FAD-dependent oxidoreductase [Gammaproteobacteria bacterium]